MSSLVTDAFWDENFALLIPQAKKVLSSPPIVGERDQTNRVLAALIIGVADLHVRLKQLQPQEPVVKLQ